MARTTTVIQIGDRLAERRPATATTTTTANNLAKIGVRDNEAERFSAVASLNSFNDAVTYINASAAAEVDDRLQKAENLGAAWLWFISRWAKGLKQPDLAPLFEYSVGHLRLCGRLFDRRAGTESPTSRDCVAWYDTNKEQLKFKPRKAEGLDYVWGCIRARDAFQKIADANPSLSQDQVFAETDKKLTGGEIIAPPTTQQQQLIRFGIVAAHAIALLRKNKIESELSKFEHMTDLANFIATIPWKGERDVAAWDAVRNIPFFRIEMSDDFYDRDASDKTESQSENHGDETVRMTATLTESQPPSPQPAQAPTYTQADVERIASERAQRAVAESQQRRTTKRKAPAKKRAQSS